MGISSVPICNISRASITCLFGSWCLGSFGGWCQRRVWAGQSVQWEILRLRGSRCIPRLGATYWAIPAGLSLSGSCLSLLCLFPPQEERQEGLGLCEGFGALEATPGPLALDRGAHRWLPFQAFHGLLVSALITSEQKSPQDTEHLIVSSQELLVARTDD